METSGDAIRAVAISLAILLVTAGLQTVIVVISPSIALFGDALHNFADALTALPLAIAFTLGRRPPTRRYTYGYGRAEDLAGIAIVATIASSSIAVGYESVHRLLDPRAIHHLPYVAIAAIVGFAGNEIVAQYRITVGRRIGSAALVADGLHARADGLTSLAVLIGVGGVAAGWKYADPVVGLVVTFAICFVLRDAARRVYRRLMDAVDPHLVDDVEQTLRGTPGVLDIGNVKLRWIGHQLRAECEVVVNHECTVIEAHDIAEEAQHRLLHDVPRLTAAIVHADPFAHEGTDHHTLTAHHQKRDR